MKMKLIIEIDGNNAAFWEEIDGNLVPDFWQYRSVLRDVMKNIATLHMLGEMTLRDINGNVCGHARFLKFNSLQGGIE